MDKHILYLTGLSGSGKSAVLEQFEELGAGTFYTGDIIPPSCDERLKYGDELAEETGFIAKARRTALEKNRQHSLIVVDSIRSMDELAYVRQQPEDDTLVGVICEDDTRVERIRERDDRGVDEIRSRDRYELGLVPDSSYEVGALLAIAERYIDNSKTWKYTCNQVRDVYEEGIADGC